MKTRFGAFLPPKSPLHFERFFCVIVRFHIYLVIVYIDT